MSEYYHRVFGWTDFQDIYEEMVLKFDNARFAEIGVFQGRSAIYMAGLIKDYGKNIKLTCIDLWPTIKDIDNNPELGIGQGTERDEIAKLKKPIFNVFMDYVNDDGYQDIIEPVKAVSWEAANMFPDESFEFVFIDAGHVYENVRRDIEAWLPKVKKDGFIGGHDWLSHGVTPAVQDVFKDDYEVRRNSWLHRKK